MHINVKCILQNLVKKNIKNDDIILGIEWLLSHYTHFFAFCNICTKLLDNMKILNFIQSYFIIIFQVTFGIVSSDTRWQDCVTLTTATFGMAVGHMFVKETFDESAKTAVSYKFTFIQVHKI